VQSFLVDVKRGRIPTVNKPELFDFLAQVYGIAYKHAAVLFAREGVWMDDPNPGNIVLRQSEKGIQVALIDFANGKQGNPAQRGGLTEDELRKKSTLILDLYIINLKNKPICIESLFASI
jgi:hypothetical protein